MKKLLLSSILIAGMFIPSAYALDWNHTHHNGYNVGDKIGVQVYNLGFDRGWTFEYTVPHGTCMTKEDLPTMFDSRDKQKITIEKVMKDYLWQGVKTYSAFMERPTRYDPNNNFIELTEENRELYREFLLDFIQNRKEVMHPVFGYHFFNHVNHFFSPMYYNILRDNNIDKLTAENLPTLNSLGERDFLKLSNGKVTFLDSDIYTDDWIKYSTDNGASWKSYVSIDDPGLPNDCNITNFKINDIVKVIKQEDVVHTEWWYYYWSFESDLTTNAGYIGYTWNVTVTDKNKGYLVDRFKYTKTDGSEEVKERSLVQNADILKKATHTHTQTCETRDVHINIIESNWSTNNNLQSASPTTTPPTTTNTNTTNTQTNIVRTPSGPGGYTPNITPIKTEVEPPKPTISGNESSQEKEKETPTVTEEKKTTTSTTTTTPPKQDPKPSAPTTSGPGGYTPNVTPIKTEVEPPKPTVNENTPSAPQKEEKATEIKEEIKSETPKPETPSFSMDFVEVVTQKLPSILPKMGAFTGSSRSGNGMVRDNHGILRSAKDIIKLLDTKINSRDFRLAGSTNTELSHWLQVLDSHEKNMDKYVVIPSVGLVMPIADVAKTDKAYKNFLSGKTEHFYDYAGKGAVGIPDVGNKFGENGNKIIAGHSSWWKDDTSVKYKTHFQKIINLKAGTEIWVYEKDTTTGEYTRHVYQANESYNTSETDVSILKQTKDSILTLFTCTPVGGDIGRWVVKAKLVR